MATAYTTAIKMTSAALLAYWANLYLQLPSAYWAIISIAAITQFGLSQTLTKSVMRTVGTLLGATLGFVIAYIAQGHVFLILTLFLLLILGSSLIAIQETIFSYGAIVTGLTMVIVISSTQFDKTGALFSVAVTRSVEVMLGIAALLVCNLLLSLCYRVFLVSWRDFIATIIKIPQEFRALTFNFQLYRVALKIALTCLVTFGIWLYFRQPEGFWATVTCLLIMEESVVNTKIKSTLRFVANTGAAFFSAVVALLVGDHLILRLLALCFGFFVCGYIIGTQKKYASLGNTMGVAIAIMLLFDPGTSSSFHIILDRFLNVTLGIAAGVLITQFLWVNPSKELKNSA